MRIAASVLGHKDRAEPLRGYCKGLLVETERKSVEPMAAAIAPERTSPQHQSLLHFVGNAAWSDAAVLGKVRELILPTIEKHGLIEAWILDDTGYPKKGKHSVGVARQYCGQLEHRAINLKHLPKVPNLCMAPWGPRRPDFACQSLSPRRRGSGKHFDLWAK
jgi:SRSO17 transposase